MAPAAAPPRRIRWSRCSSAEQNETQDIKATGAQPDVKMAIKQFTQAVNSAKSVAQLLANPAVMKVLLTANGMQDQIGYTALATKALTSDLTDPKSLANVLTDTRWKGLAKSLQLRRQRPEIASRPQPSSPRSPPPIRRRPGETSQDAVAPGLSKALDFKARASTITSVDQILGDPTIRTVVTTALGIPQQIAFQDLRAQENAISHPPRYQEASGPEIRRNLRPALPDRQQRLRVRRIQPDLTTLAIQGQGLLA